MSDILRVMIQIWDMDTMDWLGYDNLERYSFHHLQKKSDGGKKTSSRDKPVIKKEYRIDE